MVKENPWGGGVAAKLPYCPGSQKLTPPSSAEAASVRDARSATTNSSRVVGFTLFRDKWNMLVRLFLDFDGFSA